MPIEDLEDEEIVSVSPEDFVSVDLPPADWRCGWSQVERMQAEAIARDAKNARGLRGKKDPTEFVLCELAVAHNLGRIWTPTSFDDRLIKPDVDPDISVKGIDTLFSDKGNRMSLLVPPYHVVGHDDWKFVLVLWEDHTKPFFKIVGWKWGREVRQYPLTDKDNDRDPAHFCDWRTLRPWRTL